MGNVGRQHFRSSSVSSESLLPTSGDELFHQMGRNHTTSFGVPSILHSDQGRNFESDMLHQMLQAFEIKKSRTTAYHPQCDGMVERFNRSLL